MTGGSTGSEQQTVGRDPSAERFLDEMQKRSIYFTGSGAAYRGRRVILRDPDHRAASVLDPMGIRVADAADRIGRAAKWAESESADTEPATERARSLCRRPVTRGEFTVVDITDAETPRKATRNAVRALRGESVDARYATVYFGQALPGSLTHPARSPAADPNASTAAPAPAPGPWSDALPSSGAPAVAILDTGLTTAPGAGGRVPAHPRLRGAVAVHDESWDLDDVLVHTREGAVVIKCADEDRWDENGDDRLDRQAGHGTFIAGLVRRLAPTAAIHVDGCLTSFGDGDDESVTRSLDQLVDRLRGTVDLDRLVVNLSFGGYSERDQPPPLLAAAIAELVSRGVVFVAAAGNDNTARPLWPAALPGVIAAGALDGTRKAAFSNYGGWVDACAPAVDVVSTFFGGPGDGSPDSTGFRGYASWSGTSFAAPQVAAAIVNEVSRTGASAAEAAAAIVADRRRHRVPDLGVVVT